MRIDRPVAFPSRPAARTRSALFLAFVCASLASCTIDQRREEAEILHRIEQDRAWQLQAFDQEQRALEADYQTPHELHIDGRGSIIVHRVELKGGPDRPLVHVQFTFVNTTGNEIPIPTVNLIYNLPDGQEFVGAGVELSRPFGVKFANGNAHTSWIDAPTGGLHLVPGWTWSLEVMFPGEDPAASE